MHVHAMHDAAMRLAEYLDLRGLTDAEFAAQIGRDRTSVLRYRRGEVRPDWKTMAVIAAATNGAVSPNDFLPDQAADAGVHHA